MGFSSVNQSSRIFCFKTEYGYSIKKDEKAAWGLFIFEIYANRFGL
jgi:hypothetical protein